MKKNTFFFGPVSLVLISFSIGSQAFAAESCEIFTTHVVKGTCEPDGVYVGPWDMGYHGGTCIIPVGCKIKAVKTMHKSCGDATYIGPEESKKHGGYCVSVESKKFSIMAKETPTRECPDKFKYVGANQAHRHHGHCVKIIKQ